MVRAPDELDTMMDILRHRISRDRLWFTYARSPGPGGQNVNKVNTRATLLFDVQGATVLSAREKDRIRAKLGTRITKEGLMRVVSFRHRSQSANRRAAVRRFYELIAWALHQKKIRKPTMLPARVRRRRLQEKRERGQQKRLRRGPAEEKLDD